MLESAKVLVLSPQDRNQWQNLATSSKTVSDSIKSLVTNIRSVVLSVEKSEGIKGLKRNSGDNFSIKYLNSFIKFVHLLII